MIELTDTEKNTSQQLLEIAYNRVKNECRSGNGETKLTENISLGFFSGSLAASWKSNIYKKSAVEQETEFADAIQKISEFVGLECTTKLVISDSGIKAARLKFSALNGEIIY